MRRISLIVAVAVITSGCLTLTPMQRDAVVDVQRFADATTTAYKMASIRLTIEPATNLGIGGALSSGQLLSERDPAELGQPDRAGRPRARPLRPRSRRAAIGRRLDWPKRPTQQELRELDANAKAVEILVRVKGLSERQAVTMMLVASARRPGVSGAGEPEHAGASHAGRGDRRPARALPGSRDAGSARPAAGRDHVGGDHRAAPGARVEAGRSVDLLVGESHRIGHVRLVRRPGRERRGS